MTKKQTTDNVNKQRITINAVSNE